MADDKPEIFQRLIQTLDAAGVVYDLTHHEPVYTSAQAASVRGTPLCSGAKAIILKCDHGFVMVVMPADRIMKGSAVRKFLHSRRLRFASKEELLELTGLTPGAVPPFGSLFGLRTVCDRRLGENQRINFNAGSHGNSLQLDYQAWVKVESPEFADFSIATEDRE